MVDLKWLREHAAEAKVGFDARGRTVDVERILALDEEYRELLQRVENAAAEKNAASKDIATLAGAPRDARIAEMRALDERTDAVRAQCSTVERSLHDLLWSVPNLPMPDVPVGSDETANEVMRTVGTPRSFGFTPRAHWELGQLLGAFDTERGAKVVGARFAYLTGPGALLEFALLNHAMRLLVAEGFTPMIPPVLIGATAMDAMGYTIHGGAQESYYFEQDDLYLVGTSEQSIGPFHMQEILREAELPKRYVAFSPCFRRESGSYGKDAKGIFRVHQFDKVEMFSFTTPEESDAEHERLLGFEERLMQELELPYRVMKLSTGDMGIASARTYDIEVWFPSEGGYRELTSTSTCTDWQARRLNIRYRPTDGSAHRFVHTLNGTAWSMNRPICAILENGQQEDGSVIVPRALQALVGMERLIPQRS